MASDIDDIVFAAGQTRLSVTGARLIQLQPEKFTAQEQLEILYWLLLCGKCIEACAYVKILAAATLDARQQGRLYAACLRLSLLDSSVDMPPEPPQAYLPRWVKAHLQRGENVVYPPYVTAVSLARDSRRELCLELECTCIACSGRIKSSIRSDLVVLVNKQVSEWLCPHCLALQRTDMLVVRERLWDIYAAYFEKLPRNPDSMLEIGDAVEAILLANALEPYAPIRFCSLRQERIGHFCMAGARIVEQLAGEEKLTLDYYGFETEQYVSNTALGSIWKRFFNSSIVAQQLYWLAHSIGMRHLGPLVQHITYKNAFRGRYSYPLQLNCSEVQKGLRALELMGIPRGAKIACLFVRDASYLSSVHPVETDDGNTYRNADVDTYQKACEELAARGWYVVRMGAVASKPLAWASEHIIDYATHFRTEFMDVWLWLYCDLCMGMASGPDVLFAAEDRPWLLTNAVDLWYLGILSPNSVVLPKHVQTSATQERMSLKEYLLNEVSIDKNRENIVSQYLKFANNTEEEIYDALCEQLAILEGKHYYSKEEAELQEYYKNLASYKYENWGDMRAKFSIKFLQAES